MVKQPETLHVSVHSLLDILHVIPSKYKVYFPRIIGWELEAYCTQMSKTMVAERSVDELHTTVSILLLQGSSGPFFNQPYSYSVPSIHLMSVSSLTSAWFKALIPELPAQALTIWTPAFPVQVAKEYTDKKSTLSAYVWLGVNMDWVFPGTTEPLNLDFGVLGRHPKEVPQDMMLHLTVTEAVTLTAADRRKLFRQAKHQKRLQTAAKPFAAKEL